MLEEVYQSSDVYDKHPDLADILQALSRILEISDSHDEYEDFDNYKQAVLRKLDEAITIVQRERAHVTAERERLRAKIRSISVPHGMSNIDLQFNKRQSSRASDSRVETSQKSAQSEFSDTPSRTRPFRTLPKHHLRLLCLLGRD